MKRLVPFVVIAAVAAQAVVQKLPSAELTRFVSPGGIEYLSLRCVGDRTAKEGYSCELSQQRNGVTLNRAMVAPRAVDAMLRRYFQRVPKERTEPTSSGFQGESRAGADLNWSVSFGGLASRGSASRGVKRDLYSAIAIIALENELSAHFLK